MVDQQINIRFLWLSLALFAAACSPKKANPVTTKAPSSEAQNVATKTTGESATSSGNDDVGASYRNTSLEVLFSRVLSRGFRAVSKRNNISAERCRSAMQVLVNRGDTSRRFLETKLSEGSLGEKALALWSLGSMGPSAKPAHRAIASAMTRSWLVPIERCQKKGGDATSCRQRVLAKSAPWTIVSGCRALANVNSRRGVEQVAEQGLGGQMSLPCLPMYVRHNDLPTVRERLIESYELPEVRAALMPALERNPKSALSLGVYWLRREKHKADVSFCPLEKVLGKTDSAVMKSLAGRLHAEELSSLKMLGEELSNPGLKQCADTYLKALGAPATSGFLKVKQSETASTTAYFAVGDFCPESKP